MYPVPADKKQQQGCDSTEWLKVEKIRRGGKDGNWEPVEGEQWMPSSGGGGNGGQLLHPINEK